MFKYSLIIIFSIISLSNSLLYRKYNLLFSPNYTKSDNLEYISDGIIVEDIPSREIFVKNEHAVDGYYDIRGIYRYY